MAGTAIVHALTHTGAVRAGNEDAVAVDDWICANDLTKPKPFRLDLASAHAVLVADGMGGHPGGDVASRRAVAFCAARAAGVADRNACAALLDAVNHDLYEAMSHGSGPPGMGTTLAGLVIRADGLLVLNVGDSKIHRADPGQGLEQVSVDDTPGPKLADGRTAARNSPMLSQTLGGQMRETPITPHAEARTWSPGERYLLSSDGLTDLVGPEQLADILARENDAQAVTAMFDAAMAEGGRDNVTIALVRLVGA